MPLSPPKTVSLHRVGLHPLSKIESRVSRMQSNNSNSSNKINFDQNGCEITRKPDSLRLSVENYCHSEELKKLEETVKELSELNEKLSRANVRSHMLEVELLTQFSPYTVEMIRKAEISCKKCEQTMTCTAEEQISIEL
ncbi:uncharacterized protein LOC141900615 [Tubulanus polymorphus]|uniref:uncharacterized protein LOC141900615 n=1 Tax=Tubulanus polymorphus TaxID=672921 RepID=UPI003DA526B3